MSDLSATKKKILLLLLGGATLCLTYSPRQYFKVLKIIGGGWKKIKKEQIRDEIRQLYRSKLIEIKTGKDGVSTLILSDKGRNKILRFNLDNMEIKKHPWDHKWRIVIFDIPEKQRVARDALRFRLKKLGFYELQKSVFVYPFHCQDEVDFITEFFQLRPYVRYGLLESIDNEFHLKQIFKI